MELLNNFGFEPILFIAQIVNILIVFFVLKKFLFKPLVKTLEDRKHKISEGLHFAEEAEKRLQEATEKEEQILRKAQDFAKKMLDETKTEQAKMLKEAEASTQALVNKMLKDAREQISFETTQAEKKLSMNISKLAVQFLQTAVKELFGPQEQEIIMKNALTKLKKKAN